MCWLHGCMFIMSYAVQYPYNSNILTCCGNHWMAKSTPTRQCLLSHVSSGTRTQLNAHLFREGISFVGAACFHRDSPDVLAASSGSWLLQPGWCQVCISVCVCVHTSRTAGLQMWKVYMWQVYLCIHACVCTCMPWCVTVCTGVTFTLYSHVQLPLCLLQLRRLPLSLVLHLHQEVILVVFAELQM